MNYVLASKGRGGSLLVYTREEKPLDIMSTYFNHEVWSRSHGDPIPDMPLDVQLELVNRCNLTCEACPIHSLTRDRSLLPWGIMKNIVDEAARETVAYFTICGIGEASLHPNLFPLLRYIRSRRVEPRGLRALWMIPSVLISNLMWSANQVDECIAHPPDLLSVSLAGFRDEDIITRRGGIKLDQFREFLQKIYTERHVRREREDGGLSPTIHVSTHVHPSEFADEELSGQFIESWLKFSDAVVIKPTMLDEHYTRYAAFQEGDPLSYDQISETSFTRTAPCMEVSRRLSISSDGEVWCGHHLAEDFGEPLGNINKQTLREIWHSEKLDQFRRETRAGIFNRKCCKTCGGELREFHRQSVIKLDDFTEYR